MLVATALMMCAKGYLVKVAFRIWAMGQEEEHVEKVCKIVNVCSDVLLYMYFFHFGICAAYFIMLVEMSKRIFESEPFNDSLLDCDKTSATETVEICSDNTSDNGGRNSCDERVVGSSLNKSIKHVLHSRKSRESKTQKVFH